ncbi:hypothetical protein [Rubripirellula amarantea]|nr:hypothetical protein [Rubripirellula amarantea]
MDYYNRSLELQKQLKLDSHRFPMPLRLTCQELLQQTLSDVKRLQ